MMTPLEIQNRIDKILLKVAKPGRYVGGELNVTVKDWDAIQTRVALVFPDIYDIGVSNVGLKILYDQVNQREDALAERAYVPWPDMEALMRSNGIPLYGLETFHPLSAFDILGFSLPYETLYTNALNALDLAGKRLEVGGGPHDRVDEAGRDEFPLEGELRVLEGKHRLLHADCRQEHHLSDARLPGRCQRDDVRRVIDRPGIPGGPRARGEA